MIALLDELIDAKTLGFVTELVVTVNIDQNIKILFYPQKSNTKNLKPNLITATFLETASRDLSAKISKYIKQKYNCNHTWIKNKLEIMS